MKLTPTTPQTNIPDNPIPVQLFTSDSTNTPQITPRIKEQDIKNIPKKQSVRTQQKKKPQHHDKKMPPPTFLHSVGLTTTASPAAIPPIIIS